MSPIFDSDNVSLQLDTDSTHVVAGFELHFELLANGVERLGGTPEDVLDSLMS